MKDAVAIKVLLALYVDQEPNDLALNEQIVYRPGLERRDPLTLTRALAAHRPDVLIARRYPASSVGAAWRELVPGRALLAIAIDPGEEADPALEWRGIVTEPFQGPLEPVDGQSLLALAERTWTRVCTCADLPRKLSCVRAAGGRSVVMAGAGIVNLISAMCLQREGYDVSIFDDRPDPRMGLAWTEYGCTRGGDNARMFTLTEGDDYHDKDSQSPDSSNAIFDRRVSEGGWRVSRSPSVDEAEWLDEFRSVPPWLARAYTDDIVHFNREGGERWGELMEHDAALFENANLRDGILRLYTHGAQFQSQIARHHRLGATNRVLLPREVAERHPGLAGACHRRELIGGIEVVGFTVSVHDLVERILACLEQGGATLHWSTRVEKIGWDTSGLAEGLIIGGELVGADHYVLSPGAYGADLLRGTASDNLIHGVLGVWLTLPNVSPMLEHSLKIARTGHVAEDSNVTVGQASGDGSVLMIGSGYGWTGADPTNIDPAQLSALHAAVDDTARRFFPESYAVAQESGMLDASRRFCIRPWTASNLPVFEMAKTGSGGALVLTGGHNTGGFAQAPAVAAAVRAALKGEQHPMHVLYDPRRPRGFRERSITRADARS
jgi:glycine/D-amino acid oxidase-like deaminating enzyme